MYSVSIDNIYQLNPGSKDAIQTGSQLKIPQESGSYLFHTIQPKETLYSVSRKYQMKGEDILDANPGLSIETFTAGKTIRIPTNRVTTPMEGSNEYLNQSSTNALLNNRADSKDIKTVKVALLLPFGLKEEAVSSRNSVRNRMVEYYEGFLLALEDIKKKGISVDLQVYDIGSGTDLLPAVLKKPAMQNVNLIIGGLNDKQIKLISYFSHERKIPYVFPFTSKSDEPLNYENVYQINTPQSYLYSKASTAFCNKYKSSNVIIYVPNSHGNKLDFIEVVKKDMTAKNISYKILEGNIQSQDIQNVLDNTKNNVFIPADDGSEALSKLITPLKIVTGADPRLSVSLFGYPSWQVYSTDHASDFFHLNATFYSIFYANPTSSKVKSFQNNYHRWYSKEMINTFPKFGMLGYDTGTFFVQLLNKYGTSYDVNINKLNVTSVQTDFYFERVNNWGGFINTNIYMVEYNPNFTITSNRFK
jgi:LysM repeat protein